VLLDTVGELGRQVGAENDDILLGGSFAERAR
jgi:hypothetical protein